MKFDNLTPHDISFYDEYGFLFTVKPSGNLCRIREDIFDSGRNIMGVQVVTSCMDVVVGLPEPKPGVIYLVSMQIALAVTDRLDVFCPDTSTYAVRDEAGRIIGTKALKRFSKK